MRMVAGKLVTPERCPFEQRRGFLMLEVCLWHDWSIIEACQKYDWRRLRHILTNYCKGLDIRITGSDNLVIEEASQAVV